ncbi:uncharacterized protein [Eurosta solidaginis]|uniref:uncharacterized protein n=1 Tax=Eurosta solidaginis TaxID=178769 RepID=UPI00353150B0
MFKCFLCNFVALDAKSLVAHLKTFHTFNKIKKFICNVPKCGQCFSNVYTFQIHLKRVHARSAVVTSSQEQQAFYSARETHENVRQIGPTASSENIAQLDINRFILSLHDKNNFNRKDVLYVLDNVNEKILKLIQEHVLMSISPLIPDLNQRIFIQNQFRKFVSPFEHISSEYRFLKSIENEEIFKFPSSYTISEEISEIVINNSPGLHSNKVVGVIMPIKFQIAKYFQSKSNLKDTLENMQTLKYNNQCYTNVIHGETWEKKICDFNEKLVIPYIIYYDDFGIDNPLGSHAAVQTVCGIYYSFATISNHSQSTLENKFCCRIFQMDTSKGIWKYVFIRTFSRGYSTIRNRRIDSKYFVWRISCLVCIGANNW